jgi:WG containing repeat
MFIEGHSVMNGTRIAFVLALIMCVLVPPHRAGSLGESAQTGSVNPGDQHSRQGVARLMAALRADAIARGLDEGAKFGSASISFPLPLCVFERGLCGAVNRDGTIVVPPNFDWVGSFHQGRALVRSHGLYGYVDLEGRVVVKPQYQLAGDYWHGFAEVDIGGKSGLIDREGRIVVRPEHARVLPFGSGAFWVKDGLRRAIDNGGFAQLVTNHNDVLYTQILVDGPWKLIDKTGALITTSEISSIQPFDKTGDNLMWAHATSGWGLMRTDGTWLVPPKYEVVRSLTEGYAAVRVLGKWGYVDRSGTIAIAPTFDQAWSFRNGYAAVQRGTEWGYIDRTGMMVIQPQFSSAEGFEDDGLALVKVDGRSGVIDKSGAWVVEARYDKIWRDRTHIIWAEVGGKFGAFERSGRMIASPQFSQIGIVCDDGWVMGFANGTQRIIRDMAKPLTPPAGELSGLDCSAPFRIQVGSKFGFVDRMLKPITDIRFDNAYPFSEHAAAVELDGRFGFIKDDGSWLIEPRFWSAKSFSDGAAVVNDGGKLGYIRADGTWQIEPTFDQAEPFVLGFAIVYLGGRRGIIDRSGAWLGDTLLHQFSRAFERRGLVAVKSGTKWGFVEASGAMVIEAKYDEVLPAFERGIAWAKLEGSWCSIDRQGQPVSALSCRPSAPVPVFGLGSWP